MSIMLHSWRRKDPHTGRWRVLRWKMTEEDAKRWASKEGAELEKVLGSDETRADVRGQGVAFSTLIARRPSRLTLASWSRPHGRVRMQIDHDRHRHGLIAV